MEINDINKVVFEYLIKMIEDDDRLDIHNIEYEQYRDIVFDRLNNWNTPGYTDIITEYFGNQSTFEPSLTAHMYMYNFVIEDREEWFEDYGDDTKSLMTDLFNLLGNKNDLLRHYAHWYIDDMGHEEFCVELKKHLIN
jgi:hypothetical protein